MIIILKEIAIRKQTRCMSKHKEETMSDVGKKIWSRDKSECGIVTAESQQYCAACGMTHSCDIVLWPDGKRTKPCTKGIECLSNGELQIM